MTTSATIVADSEWDGVRLTTILATFPRFILPQFTRHRSFSFNTASSRAIPLAKQIEMIEADGFVPEHWPKNRRGMSATEEIINPDHAEVVWLDAMDWAITHAKKLAELDVHKQVAARLLEPFMHVTAIVSTTMPGLENFFDQRINDEAQPEMQELARAIRDALEDSTPVHRAIHIPFGDEPGPSTGLSLEDQLIRSVSKCARVSYGRELEERSIEDDRRLVASLIKNKHASPMEHVSWVMPAGESACDCSDCYSVRLSSHEGNFKFPWEQLRHNLNDMLPKFMEEINE